MESGEAAVQVPESPGHLGLGGGGGWEATQIKAWKGSVWRVPGHPGHRWRAAGFARGDVGAV